MRGSLHGDQFPGDVEAVDVGGDEGAAVGPAAAELSIPGDQPAPVAMMRATLVVSWRLRSCTAVRWFESASVCAVTTAR
jgi:hypothetical protein